MSAVKEAEGAPAEQEQAQAPEVAGFSLDTFYNKGQEKPEVSPPVDETATPSQPEEKGTIEPVAQPEKPDETLEPEAKKDKPISKEEREKFKLREKIRERDAKIKALQEQYGIDEEPAPVDEAARIRAEERALLTRDLFIERHGETTLKDKIEGEGTPWAEIEEQARQGDVDAMQYVSRVAASRNPYEEALSILDEVELFEKYETRNVSQLIAKALKEQEAALEAKYAAQLTPTRVEVGKQPKTLADVSGENPATSPKMPADFTLSAFYSRK